MDVLIGESLDFLQGGFLVPGMRILDRGSGAGVPGIPLAICSVGLHFTLLDRSEKKITFLHRVVSLLRLENCAPCFGWRRILTGKRRWRKWKAQIVRRS